MLSADFLHLSDDVACVNCNADLFHLDIMDGYFVPNLSYGFPVVEAIHKEAKLPLDVHLMIIHPEKYLERFAKAGAAMISFHLEAAWQSDVKPEDLLAQIRSYGVKAGLVINPDVPVEKLYPYLELCDYVVIMSVFAGFGGQKFIEDTYERVRTLKAEIDRRNLDCPIEVDGGVNAKNADALADAGTELFVAGSSYFKAEDREALSKAIRGL